jgi:ribosome maturation factor RimP
MVASSPQFAAFTKMLQPSIEAMGYDIVQVRLIDNYGRQTLQVMAERFDHEEMTVDDCAQISRAASALLDVEDPIRDAYDLEISSPGVDRPLTRFEDFERFSGFDAKVEMKRLIAGQRRFRGRLLGTRGPRILIAAATPQGGEQSVELPFDEIDRAKLVMSDDLLAATMKKRKMGS